MEINEEDDGSSTGIEREPRITSSDPNERKLARKLRIQRRLEAIRRQQVELEGGDADEVEIRNPVQQQILRSYELLEKYIHQADEYISNVRIANDSREVDRREREGLGREKIIENLQEEATLAEEKFNEIADKWGEILRYNDPLHINDAIAQQKEGGAELVAQKDALIASLQLELRHAERNFALDQRKQIEDITTLSQRIEKQVCYMRITYNQELNAIETAMIGERDKLLEEAHKHWEDLYKERDLQEEKNAEAKEEALKRYHQQLTILRMDFQELYRATKIRIEREIEELQKELESIKALTMINNEKLDYNYQILKKREDENIKIKSQQKRRINKLRDIVISLRKKNKQYEENSNNMIKKLEQDIIKLNVCILEVESKADHFAMINDKKFHSILEMNKLESEMVLRRILDVDKIIHVQQMGEQWAPFEVNLRFHFYDKLRNKQQDHTSIYSNAERLSLTTEFEEAGSFTSLNSGDVSQNKWTANHLAELKEHEGYTPNYCSLVKKILSKLADNTGFLAEEKLMEILAPYADIQKTVIGVDTTFEALGVMNKDDVDLLVQYFLPYTHCPICVGEGETDSQKNDITEEDSGMLDGREETIDSLGAKSSISQSFYTKGVEFSEGTLITSIQESDQVYSEVLMANVIDGELDDLSTISKFDKPSFASIDHDPEVQALKVTRFMDMKDQESQKKSPVSIKIVECAMHHPLSISPVHALTALKKFVTAFYSGQNQIVKLTMADRLNNKRETVSRQLPGSEIKKFWARYKNAFSAEKQQLWNALLTGLKKYHEILKQRKMLSKEVMRLRNQNAELKQILSNYMHHGKIMEPPCGEIRQPKKEKVKCIEKTVR